MSLITKMVITYKNMINQTDINYLVEILSKAIKSRDWDLVTEVQEYIIDFQDEPQYEEE